MTVTRGPVLARHGLNFKLLVGSGDKIVLATLPFLGTGLALNVTEPSAFDVGGPPAWLLALSAALLLLGVVVWLWSVALILTKVPAGQLMTTGPYSWVKHPLYSGVSLVVGPWLGFVLDTWLGAAVGVVMYLWSRRFAKAEESELSSRFGSEWDAYAAGVRLPWL